MSNMKLHIGQRIDIFEVRGNIYGALWKKNGWYPEKPNSPYAGNKYGRDMVSEPHGFGFVAHQNIINEHVKKGMVKVGTVIIKTIK